MNPPGEYLFVYGTLLTGSGRRWLDAAVRRLPMLGRGWIQARLYELGAYPGAVRSERPTERVHGILLLLPRWGGLLRTLDRYEAYHPAGPHRSEFCRTRVTAHIQPGDRAVSCWAYLYCGRLIHRPRLRSGDYAARVTRRRAPFARAVTAQPQLKHPGR